MKVLHISTSDVLGGAAIAATRLHNAMLSNGIDSRMLILNKYSFRGKYVHLVSLFYRKIWSSLSVKIEKIVFKTQFNFGKYSFPFLGVNLKKYSVICQSDIIYVHWISSGFLNFNSLTQLFKTNKKIYIVLHDMWFITGGCHHSFDCVKYQTRCFDCHMLKEKRIDFAKIQFFKKRSIYEKYPNVCFISPSNWMTSSFKYSAIVASNNIFTIPNLIDLDVFKPIDNSHVGIREYFTGTTNKTIVAFCAESGANNPYKGFSYFKDAILKLENDYNIEKDIVLLVIGAKEDKELASIFNCKIVFIDRLVDDISMCLIFNAIDVFVTPSLAESFCLTALEAISCGTPVVAFDIGGLPDIITHNYNGYLAQYRNANDLSRCIYESIYNPIPNIKQNTRKSALRFSSNNIVRQHMELWNTSV